MSRLQWNFLEVVAKYRRKHRIVSIMLSFCGSRAALPARRISLSPTPSRPPGAQTQRTDRREGEILGQIVKSITHARGGAVGLWRAAVPGGGGTTTGQCHAFCV